MGYYSEVVLVVRKKYFKFPDNPNCEWARSCIREAKCNGEDVVILHLESVKWYDQFEGIQAFSSLMAEWDDIYLRGYDPDDLEDIKEAACQILDTGDIQRPPIYGFMRLGEEFGDISISGDPSYFGIYSTQSIMVDINLKEESHD